MRGPNPAIGGGLSMASGIPGYWGGSEIQPLAWNAQQAPGLARTGFAFDCPSHPIRLLDRLWASRSEIHLGLLPLELCFDASC